MKRIGLFLLAVVMVAGLAGCNDDNDNSVTAPEPVPATVNITFNLSCKCGDDYYGQVKTPSQDWLSQIFDISPCGSETVTVPSEGKYHVLLISFDGHHYFETDVSLKVGTYSLTLNCN